MRTFRSNWRAFKRFKTDCALNQIGANDVPNVTNYCTEFASNFKIHGVEEDTLKGFSLTLVLCARKTNYITFFKQTNEKTYLRHGKDSRNYSRNFLINGYHCKFKWRLSMMTRYLQ